MRVNRDREREGGREGDRVKGEPWVFSAHVTDKRPESRIYKYIVFWKSTRKSQDTPIGTQAKT